MSSSDLVFYVSINKISQLCAIYFSTLHRNLELSTIVALHYFTDPFLLAAMVPIKIYSNTEADKDTILSDNKKKSGIYMWTNNINKKRYIGSSENLRARFQQYFNINHLIRYNCMQICRALLKHDYFNFSLTIIEYCEPKKCIERERFYLSSENPEYNIANNPTAPMSGRKHSDETKIIMSDAKKGENHPNYGKTRDDKIKQKISDALKGQPRPSGAGSPSQAIEVTDITNDTTTSYNSMSEAARALNIHPAHFVIYFSRNQKKAL